MSRFSKKLQEWKTQSRLRALTLPNGFDLTSNDYLGMRGHPALRRAAAEAIENGIDLGAGGSRLLRGHTAEHENLELFAARHFGFEKSLYFSSGFQANQAIFQALVSRHDCIIYDEYVHASSREAIANSPAKSVKFQHNDLNDFEVKLQNEKSKQRADGLIWVAVESLYSMHGDFAPIKGIQELCLQYDAYLIVDEAHATGVYDGVRGDNVVALHTCGKAVGVAGGLICASDELISVIVNTARGFIYSTAPPPLQAYLVQKSLEILAGEEGDKRRANLQNLVRFMNADSQIFPVVLGDNKSALDAAQKLQMAGYDVRAIRPPTVPEGAARLRIALTTNINEKILADFKACLEDVLTQMRAAA